MARVVRNAEDVRMYGFDNHGGLYYFNIFTGLGVPPGPPAPLPPGPSPYPFFSMHGVLTSSAWGGEHQTNETVLVDGAPIVSKGHEVKRDIHIPPGGNLLIPVTMYFASAKWLLGVGSVQATKGPVAATIGDEWGVTYNCQDPCSFFAPNIMRATATVHVQASGADVAESAVTMAVQSFIELLLSLAFNKGQEAFKKLLGKGLRRWITKLVGHLGLWVGDKLDKFLELGFVKKFIDWIKRFGFMQRRAEKQRLAAEELAKKLKRETENEINEFVKAAEKEAAKRGKKETEKDVAKMLGTGELEDAINPKKMVGEDLIHGAAEDQTKDTATKLAEAKAQTLSESAGKELR